MNFKDILLDSLNTCGKNAVDPFFLYGVLSDKAGDDYLLKTSVDQFYAFDSEYRVVKRISEKDEPRIIRELLEESKEGSAPSLKDRVHWIFETFTFYYRNKHTKTDGLDQTIACIEKDFLEPIGEILEFQKPVRAKRKKARSAVRPSPHAQLQPPAQVNPPARMQPPIMAQQTVNPPYVPQRFRYLGAPIKNQAQIGAQVNIVPARGALAPFIVGLTCFEPIAPPGSVYKILRKDTIVYVTGSRPQLHVSEQCPLLRYAYMIYRGTYEKARYEDFYRMYRFCDSNLAQYHIPPVCPTCASFTPKFFGGASILKIQDL